MVTICQPPGIGRALSGFSTASGATSGLVTTNSSLGPKDCSATELGAAGLGLLLLMVLAGSQLRVPLLWHIADVMMAFMAITNLTAMLLLSPVVRLIATDYLRQRKMGVTPVFDPKRYPDIKRQLAPGAWDDKSGS